MSAASTIGAILLSSLLLASPASASDGFDARVESSLQRLAAGDVAGAREAMESLVRSGTHPPLGALSVWLASGGVQAQDAHRWTEVDHPGEVRLQVIAAQRARQRGDLERAARHLALALALPLPDGLAISEARALGWEVADTPAGALPGPDGVTSRGLTWALVLLAMLLGLLLSAWRSRDRRGLIVIALSLSGLLLPSPHTDSEVSRPVVLDLSAQLELGEGCEVLPAVIHDDSLRLSVRCPDRYRHYGVKGLADGSVQVRRDGPGTFDTFDHEAIEALRSIPEGQLRPGVQTRVPSAGGWWPRHGAKAQLMVTQWVVIAALLSCLLGLIDGLKTWRRVLIAESTWTRYALQCAAAIVLLHVGIGEHLLMSFGVYELNPHIVEARVPRYGPGAVWFYGPAQWLFGADHVWLSRLNRFYGLGAIVMTSALALKLFKHHVGIAVVTLMLAACTPVIYLAHTSESIVVGPTFAYLTGLWFALKTDGRSGVLAALALGAAALARPEMAVVVCLTPLWLWWVRRAEHDNERLGHAWSAVAALYTLVLAQAAWLAERLQGMMISGSLDVARDADNPVGLFFWNLGGVSGPLNIVLNPMFTPTVVAIGVLAALVQRSTRQTALSVVGLSVVWMMLTTVDLTFISIPRLQLPSLLLVLPVSAAGLVSLGFLNQPLRRRLLSGLLLLGAGVTVWLNFPTTNAQTEDRFWRSALDALPDEPGCLITLRYEDPPDGGRTTRNTPDYLLTTRDPAWSVSGVLEAERTLERCPGPVYALLGMRCHAQLRNKGEAAPDASELQEGCKLLHERFTLEPVLESWVENAGDLDYPMYPRGGPLRLGLYRVLGLR